MDIVTTTSPNKFKVEFKQSPNKPALHVSGAYGGPDGFGNIAVHFYTEYPTLPTTVDIETDPKTGKVVSQKLDGRTSKFTREVVATIIMRPETTSSIAEWLQQQVAKINATKAAKKQG